MVFSYSFSPWREKVRMRGVMKSKFLSNARNLRKTATDAEQKLWSLLRRRQLEDHKFRRQEVIGNYIADFLCYEKRLIIELDGGQHLEILDQDAKRTQWLESQGYKVLRFWNDAVFKEPEGVLEVIAKTLQER